MKSKSLLVLAFLALSAVPAVAQGPYVGASAGLFIPHESDISSADLGSGDLEYEVGFGFDLKAGINLYDFRLEGEFGYKSADVDEGTDAFGSFDVSGVDITLFSFMFNGYYDFRTNTRLKPYVGAGIGLLNLELDDNGFKSDDTAFGYQFTAGVALPVDRYLSLDFYYRFQGSASDFETADDDISYTSSNINAGLRYNF